MATCSVFIQSNDPFFLKIEFFLCIYENDKSKVETVHTCYIHVAISLLPVLSEAVCLSLLHDCNS